MSGNNRKRTGASTKKKVDKKPPPPPPDGDLSLDSVMGDDGIDSDGDGMETNQSSFSFGTVSPIPVGSDTIVSEFEPSNDEEVNLSKKIKTKDPNDNNSSRHNGRTATTTTTQTGIHHREDLWSPNGSKAEVTRIRIYACTNHHTVYPMNPATVIFAKDEDHARDILDIKLAEQGWLTYENYRYDLKELDPSVPSATVLLSFGYLKND